MKNILKYLKKYWIHCICVIALLLVQAYCDLSLPDYTSKIVDTGIQNGGVESVTPQIILQSDFERLETFLKDSEISYIRKFYKETNESDITDIPLKNYKSGETYYLLNTTEEKDLKALDKTFTKTMVMVSTLGNMS